MAKPLELATRQVHLDFHTGPWIQDVGVDFNPKQFARIFKEAHVNSVTVFAKCHHGMLYYETKRAEKHPGLKKGLDLLGDQIEALHHEGIRAPIYLSVLCDEYAATNFPQWCSMEEDGKRTKWAGGVFKPGWQIMDMATPYQDYLADQAAEVLKRFKPVDGIFFDMCWDQPSVNPITVEKMIKAGVNPEVEAERHRYAHTVTTAYMKRYHAMVKASSPKATLYFNTVQSNPHYLKNDRLPYMEQVEIESLPNGGWGYMFFPRVVRYARNFGKPTVGQTARFHKSWADFGAIKNYPALEYETSLAVAQGSVVGIGDQMHPRGTLDRAAYDLIEKVYGRLEEREPWLKGAKAVTEIGVFHQMDPKVINGTGIGNEGTNEGVTRMLIQLKYQFDIVVEESDWTKYKLIILNDFIPVDAKFAKKLSDYVKKGGSILATGTSGLSADGTQVMLKDLGVKAEGLSPYSVTYLRCGNKIGKDLPETDHVMYECGVRVTPSGKAESLGYVVEPYFERAWNHFSSHHQTAPDKVTKYSIGVLNGRVAYIPFPIFTAFGRHGNFTYRQMIQNILNILLPHPLVVIHAPTSTEVSLMHQQKENRTILHVLQYCPERRAGNLDLIEDIVPLYDVTVYVKMDKVPKKVYSVPGMGELVFDNYDYSNGYLRLRLPKVNGHEMVVFE